MNRELKPLAYSSTLYTVDLDNIIIGQTNKETIEAYKDWAQEHHDEQLTTYQVLHQALMMGLAQMAARL